MYKYDGSKTKLFLLSFQQKQINNSQYLIVGKNKT